ncbi:queuosine precursor transporter [Bartonella tamiae]|uniref:Probable queuosine precursor transporter n=1 Tax=Bartonella tamiae Th239 TaxID=1094558 RepID=J1K243_9HYPH|nr:queuosine precursor transporter [Bartonella tamiae]EJF91522.1 hypothetical protein ME5_00217 [Bartonella tamiae Th239]EJF92494.1 hypothetical protein MEG_01664 [Bartonella tamiae Th307]
MSQSLHLFFASIAMCIAVTASNILVQYPFPYFGLEHLLTYGAFTYPFAFLINDLTNRRYGPSAARRVVYVGFIAALMVSWIVASPRLAIASGWAFLFAQLLDIAVFTPLRKKTWWKAPLAAAICGSILDTLLFFAIAFSPYFGFVDHLTGMEESSIFDSVMSFGITIPVWLSLALGDFGVKLVMALFMLLPYGVILAYFMPAIYEEKK